MIALALLLALVQAPAAGRRRFRRSSPSRSPGWTTPRPTTATRPASTATPSTTPCRSISSRAAARATLVWADAANESVGFTARDASGRPAPLAWDGDGRGGERFGRLPRRSSIGSPRRSRGHAGLVRARLHAGGAGLVYARRHLQPFTAPAFVVAEESLLVADVARLPAAEQQAHLALAPGAHPGRARGPSPPHDHQPRRATAGGPCAWSARRSTPALRWCWSSAGVHAPARRGPGGSHRHHPEPDRAIRCGSACGSPPTRRRSPRSRGRRSSTRSSSSSWPGPSDSAGADAARRARRLEREVLGRRAPEQPGEADGRAAQLRHLLRPRHDDDRAHDAADLAPGDGGARDRERAAQARARRRREPRGGAGRPGDPGERGGVRLAGARRASPGTGAARGQRARPGQGACCGSCT